MVAFANLSHSSFLARISLRYPEGYISLVTVLAEDIPYPALNCTSHYKIMAWYHDDGWLTRGLGPYLSTIIITTLIAILLPVLLHLFIYRPRKSASLPTFLILGPSGSGKTALLTKAFPPTPIPPHSSLTRSPSSKPANPHKPTPHKPLPQSPQLSRQVPLQNPLATAALMTTNRTHQPRSS